MGAFTQALARASKRGARGDRRWLFVPYDQLGDAVGPLSRLPPREVGIVLVECPGKAARRPYHVQKLALVLANLRHFAIEQAERGVAVRHVVADSYAGALAPLGPLETMRPAERELRAELAPLVESGQLRLLPHEGWLTTTEDFRHATEGRAWRMDAFYRHVRRRLGVLMDDGKPRGGRFSFDTENRRRWNGDPPAPALPRFAPDAITEEVCDLVRARFASHPGTLRPDALPATKADAERAWQWAKDECLESFGPFEDAMSTHARSLFHTRISPLLNLGRLAAARIVDDVVALPLPIASQEGFVRQVLGWREYMRHVHEATDGFRVIDSVVQPSGPDGASRASFLGAEQPLPPAYWGKRSGLRCLDEVVTAVWDEGYSHHITRLMILSNIAMLLDVSPRELTDWFWIAYVDAYDWVVEPNVHAMGTFGVGDVATTKPYVAGAAYIDRMSDYCGKCQFDPKTTCPLTPMYWAFLARNQERLAGVDRMKLPLASVSRRPEDRRRADRETFEHVRDTLARGEALKTGGRAK